MEKEVSGSIGWNGTYAAPIIESIFNRVSFLGK
jgi:hypothetical protein